MEIKTLNKKSSKTNEKLANKLAGLEKLFLELCKREIREDITTAINQNIDAINSFSGTEKELRKYLRKVQPKILQLIEKELKLVPKNYYRQKWLAIGLSVFGISFGVAFGAAYGNMAFIGIGLPIGMAMGIAIATSMDKKAFEAGNQLDVELGY
jgi:uncharacterized membrane protein YukC